MVLFTLLRWVPVADAAAPAVICQTGKLKGAAKYGACLLGADAKAVKAGTSADHAKCDEKFTATWFKLEGKAAGACPSGGDVTAVQTDVARFNACLARKLDGESVGDCMRVLPGSGQTTSYGAGDDGAVRPDGGLAYVDNADGTITDVHTGLMWEKKIGLAGGAPTPCNDETGACANPHDADNIYTSTAGGCCSTTAFDGTVVSIFLEQLNGRCDRDTTVACNADGDCAAAGGVCGFAGHRDWRLPNRKEIDSIIDFSRSRPSIDTAFHGASCGPTCLDLTDPYCSCTASTKYWSSTAVGATQAFGVDFTLGNAYPGPKGFPSAVRAVRGGL
jgi:hypothetical protein